MQLPGPVRAMVGLLANAADEAKQLPDRAIELPMLAVSTALQISLRAQQRYARLTARGDEILNHRAVTDDPPAWATFDEPIPVDQLRAASALLDELLDPPADAEPASAEAAPAESAPPVQPSPARKAPAKQAAAKRTPAKKPAAEGTAAARKATPRKSTKTISAPRHTTPSRFDAVDDE